MELTHFGHSCLLANFKGDSGASTTVLFDPGNFSHGFEGITGLSAILITHQHPDHADTARLPALVDANP
ncbi:MAG TPA: MBL fold metallo-hydrolase, partial [Mycobacterium sp.]|nr:MBL fold metallo-hydrolase [Mycobacterium sp.]